jgi:hypothetical protein
MFATGATHQLLPSSTFLSVFSPVSPSIISNDGSKSSTLMTPSLSPLSQSVLYRHRLNHLSSIGIRVSTSGPTVGGLTGSCAMARLWTTGAPLFTFFDDDPFTTPTLTSSLEQWHEHLPSIVMPPSQQISPSSIGVDGTKVTTSLARRYSVLMATTLEGDQPYLILSSTSSPPVIVKRIPLLYLVVMLNVPLALSALFLSLVLVSRTWCLASWPHNYNRMLLVRISLK